MADVQAQQKRTRAYRKGHEAEALAIAYLEREGWSICASRYKTAYGEIDVVAQKQDWLIFVEVKARATAEEALYAVTPRQQQRIIQAAQYYCTEHPSHFNMRFDVIAVSNTNSITHIEHAWEVLGV
jgi:putative endonuclease